MIVWVSVVLKRTVVGDWRFNYLCGGTDRNQPMTVNKLCTSLPANHIMAKQTNHVQQTRLYNIIDWQLLFTWLWRSLDSEDDFRTGSRNVSHQQQFFSELHSPRQSHYTNYRFTFPPIFNPFSFISWSIAIYHYSMAIQFTFNKLSSIFIPCTGPAAESMPLDFPVNELSFIEAAISHHKLTMTFKRFRSIFSEYHLNNCVIINLF